MPSRDVMMRFVLDLNEELALPVAEIPYALWRNPPSYMPFYPAVPEVQELRHKLRAAPVEEKGLFVSRIVAYLGVQTREEVTGERGQEVWVPK